MPPKKRARRRAQLDFEEDAVWLVGPILARLGGQVDLSMAEMRAARRPIAIGMGGVLELRLSDEVIDWGALMVSALEGERNPEHVIRVMFLCTLIGRAGGRIRLSAAELDAGSDWWDENLDDKTFRLGLVTSDSSR